MTEQIQLSGFARPITLDRDVASDLAVGDILTGEVIEKIPGITTVEVANRLAKLAGDVAIIEEVGEKLNLEITEITEDSIKLKYINGNGPSETAGSDSNEMKKALEIPKEYPKELIRAGKVLSSEEMVRFNEMVKELEVKLSQLSDTMTDKDVKMIVDSGMNPSKLSISMMSELVKHNKHMLYDHDLEKLAEEVNKAVEQLKHKYADEATLKEIVTELKRHNLPVTLKQVDKVMDMLDKMSQTRTQIGSKWMNVLKEAHSTSLKDVYKATKSPSAKWVAPPIEKDALEVMVKNHLTSLVLPTDKVTVNAAIDLMAYGIPITEDTVQIAKDPSSMLVPDDKSQFIHAVVDKMDNKELPTEVDVISVKVHDAIKASVVEAKQYVDENHRVSSDERTPDESAMDINRPIDISLKAKAVELVQRIAGFSIKQVRTASVAHEEVTIEKISGAVQDENLLISSDTVQQGKIDRDIRHFEAIRIRMTVEAAIRLEGKGIQIETRSLASLANDLEQNDRMNYTELAKVHQVESPHAVETVDETVIAYKKLSMHIQHVSAHVVENENGSSESITVRQMSVAYEQNITQIRKDLGDRIERTFDQIEPMLKELGIEPTAEAVTAGEILARNSMAITEENLLQMQMVQQKVSYVTTKMNPHLVLEMVKMGVTPLDLNLDETIELIEQYDLKFGETSPEKIGRLILELEKDGSLTQAQRESLMGIYRTFDTVVRSKGAATGFLVKNQMPLTVEKLFEAAKYIRKSNRLGQVLRVDVDDDFGRLTALSKSGKTIKEQVQTAIEEMKMTVTSATVEAVESLQSVDAESDKLMVLSKMLMDMTLTRFVDVLSHQTLSQVMIEQKHENIQQLPLNELEALIQAVKGSLSDVSPFNTALESDTVTNPTAQFDAALKFIKQQPEVVKNLLQSNIPMTPENLVKAIKLNQDPFELLIKLRNMTETVDGKLKERINHRIEEVSKAILSGDKSVDAIRNLVEDVEKDILMNQEHGNEHLTQQTSDIIKVVQHTQMLQVSHDYYQIPVMMGQEMGQLNMYILNDSETGIGSEEDTMRVIMQFKTENLGKVTAYLNIKDGALSINLQSDYDEDKPLLKAVESELKLLVESTVYRFAGVTYDDMKVSDPVHTESKQQVRRAATVKNGHFETSI